MHTTTMKTTRRIWMAGLVVLAAGALGACADEPMAVEEPYEVQMDGATEDPCIYINGTLHCNG